MTDSNVAGRGAGAVFILPYVPKGTTAMNVRRSARRLIMGFQGILVAAVALVLALATAPVQTAHAAIFPTTPCSVSQLIADINSANGTGAADTLTLTAGCTYTLTNTNNTTNGNNGLPVITNPLTINGNGATITRSTANFRFFYVQNNTNL